MRKRFHRSKNYFHLTPLLLSIFIFCGSIVFFLYGIGYLSSSNAMDEKAHLQETIQRDVVHCYALEGMYPPSLEYIETNYGLIYNKKKYIVDYHSNGSNLLPSIAIIER